MQIVNASVFSSYLSNANIDIFKQKHELLTDHSDVLDVAKHSRPRHQIVHSIMDKKQSHRHEPLGRKRQKTSDETRVYVNYFAPLLWCHIEAARKEAGYPWRPSAIAQIARKRNPALFSTLTEQLVGRWIDKDARATGKFKWSAAVEAKIKLGVSSPGMNHKGRMSILVCVTTL